VLLSFVRIPLPPLLFSLPHPVVLLAVLHISPVSPALVLYLFSSVSACLYRPEREKRREKGTAGGQILKRIERIRHAIKHRLSHRRPENIDERSFVMANADARNG